MTPEYCCDQSCPDRPHMPHTNADLRAECRRLAAENARLTALLRALGEQCAKCDWSRQDHDEGPPFVDHAFVRSGRGKGEEVTFEKELVPAEKAAKE